MEEIKNKFIESYNYHSDDIFRHIYFRLNDRETAKDLLQETFYKTWLQISRGNDIENLRAFLYRVAENLVIDYYRKKKLVSLEQMVEEGLQLKDENIVDPENKIMTEEIFNKISELPDEYKTVLTLRYVDELQIKEICEILEESENTVSVRIHRATKKLKEVLGYNKE